ncbi:MAG: MerR family transcriptional regulator [Firmicutes bacterium]|nr:MerR family transcriptional regulator [Bacillota bacterium]
MPNNDNIYPISAVMAMTNLTARQIRYYESQGLVKPARSKGNQRLFTPQDVENLVMIKNLLEKGLSIDGIKSVLINGNPKKGDTPQTVLSQQADSDVNPRRYYTKKLTSLFPVNNQGALNDLLINLRNRR